MQYDFIGLSLQSISGVRNPLLTLVGSVENDDYNFKVLADGNEIPFDVMKNYEDFVLKCALKNKQKDIKVYVLMNNDQYLIYEGKNTFIIRLKAKIYRPIKNLLDLGKAVLITLVKGIKFLWKEYHFLVPFKLWKKYYRDFKNRVMMRGQSLFYNPFNIEQYNKWLEKNERFSEVKDLEYNPLISILIPVYNIDRKYLSECIDSILNQTYSNFEICLVDDCSTNSETINTLKEYEKKDKRIKVEYRTENGHISMATNDALKIAAGEFVGLVDNDDLLAPEALYEVVRILNKNPKLDFIYSDEDKLDLAGRRCDPNFKPDFSPDSLLSSNYICHFTVLRTSIMKEIHGERVGFEGAQDYDLFLRYTEKTNNIYHISKILYHWRKVEGSTSMVISNKSYALERGKKALEEALERRNVKGIVKIQENCPYYYIEYDVTDNPKISIIIPTRNQSKVTGKCLKSIFEKTTYSNYEVIIVDNQSDERELLLLLDDYKKKYKNFKVINANFEFNYSKINNMAVSKCDGEYILLLNNDTEVITPNWLDVMVGYAKQSHIGAVGAKLIYPDDTIQHAGIILGLGGVAAHAFTGIYKDDIVWGGRSSVPYNYSGVTAACLMVKKEKYFEVNGLNEDLKVAYNDVDFNLKLLKKGYYNILVPMVMLYHYESKSRGQDKTPEKYQRFINESNYMWNNWGDFLNNDRFYNSNYSKKRGFVLDIRKSRKNKDN